MKYAVLVNRGPYAKGFLGVQYVVRNGTNKMPRHIYNALANKRSSEKGYENLFTAQLRTRVFNIDRAASTAETVVIKSQLPIDLNLRGYQVVLWPKGEHTVVPEDRFQQMLKTSPDKERLCSHCFGADGKNGDGEIEFLGFVDEQGNPADAPTWFNHG